MPKHPGKTKVAKTAHRRVEKLRADAERDPLANKEQIAGVKKRQGKRRRAAKAAARKRNS